MKDYLKPYVLKQTFLINILFLIWHAVLLCVFGYEHMWILAGFNVFSLFVYIRTLFDLRRHKPHGVIRLMYVELLLHMLISVGCIGWDCGFQEYAFGILPIIMFGDYIEESNRLRRSSIVRVVSVALCYVGLSIWTSTHAPLYSFATEAGTRVFSIVNGGATMFAICAYFLVFTHMVLGFERGLIRDASCDSLTGLANRRVLYEYGGQLPAEGAYCVFMIDVDNFKQINDTYGHDIGDRVLKAIAGVLSEYKYTLKKFLPIRWGGEEFVIVYGDDKLGGEEKVRQMEVIRQQIGELSVPADGGEIRFSATVGAAVAGEDETMTGLIAIADSRMYYGKKHGKDCLVFSHDEWRD